MVYIPSFQNSAVEESRLRLSLSPPLSLTKGKIQAFHALWYYDEGKLQALHALWYYDEGKLQALHALWYYDEGKLQALHALWYYDEGKIQALKRRMLTDHVSIKNLSPTSFCFITGGKERKKQHFKSGL